jgi:hypothetical protein
MTSRYGRKGQADVPSGHGACQAGLVKDYRHLRPELEAFLSMLRGGNTGKTIVKVAS